MKTWIVVRIALFVVPTMVETREVLADGPVNAIHNSGFIQNEIISVKLAGL